MGRGQIPHRDVDVDDNEKVYFGDDNTFSVRYDPATDELKFRHEPSSTDIVKYGTEGAETNRTTSDTVVVSEEDPTDFIQMVNATTGDEVRAWVSDNNEFLFSVYDDTDSTLVDVFGFSISDGNLRVLNDVVFPNEAGSPTFLTHDHDESSVPDIPNSALVNSAFTVNSGNGTESAGEVSLGGSFSVDISTGGVGGDEISSDAVGTTHISSGAVGTNQISDSAVSRSKLGFEIKHGASSLSSDDPNPEHETALWARQYNESEQAWTYYVNGNTIAGVSCSRGYVYVTDNNGRVNKHDIHTGNQEWSVSISGTYNNEVEAVGDTVYVGCANNRVYALDVSDGSEKWSHGHHSNGVNSISVQGGFVYSCSEAALGGDSGGRIIAARASDGSQMWSYNANTVNVNDIDVTPDYLYYTGNNQTIRKYEIPSMTQVWSHSHHSSQGSSVVYHDGAVYSGDGGGNIVGARSNDGSLVFTNSVHSSATNPNVYDIDVYDGMIYSGGRSNLASIDSYTGETVWTYGINNARGLEAHEGTVFVGNYSGSLHAVDATDGQKLMVSDGQKWLRDV